MTRENRVSGEKRESSSAGAKDQLGPGAISRLSWRETVEYIRRVLIWSRVNGADLDDLVQEICLKVVVSKVRVHKSWLRVVTRNAVSDFYRRAKSRYGKMSTCYLVDDRVVGVNEEADGYVVCSVRSPVKESLEIDFKEALDREMAELETTQRQTMTLFAEGFEYMEIAAVTGVPVGTVRSRLYYGKRKLKERLAAFR